jgi:Fe-S-cluster-containing hydrogenase component 2
LKLATRDNMCSGCRACEVLCGMVNYGEANPKKSAIRAIAHFPDPGRYEVRICDQCGMCADACPVSAIHLESGVYLVNRNECTGCYACVSACPVGAMFTHADSLAPIKCVLCGECVEYCPRNAVYDADRGDEAK